jgi:hypothetical protein
VPAVIWLHPYSYATGYTAHSPMANVWRDLVTDELTGVGR